MTALQSEIMVSGRMLPEKEDTDWFLTLTGYGETYDEVRKQFALDEEVLKESVGIRPLSLDEAVKIIFSRLQVIQRNFPMLRLSEAKRIYMMNFFLKSQNPMIVSRWKQAMEQACLL